MVKSELIKRSPLRIFEKSSHGGPGPGNIGMIVSPKGVGKTACLVHIATDKLFQGKHVIHVSFSTRVDHIISWYEDIFREIAKKRELESAVDVHDEIIKNRVIMNFNQEAIRTEQVVKSIKALNRDGHFNAHTIIIDGFDLSQAELEDIETIESFAAEEGIEVWFSVSTSEQQTDGNLPDSLEHYLEKAAIVLTLEYSNDHVQLRLLKDHDETVSKDLHLRLDPKTLLIAEDE